MLKSFYVYDYVWYYKFLVLSKLKTSDYWTGMVGDICNYVQVSSTWFFCDNI